MFLSSFSQIISAYCLCSCLTRDEVEAFLVLHTGLHLTGEQVESGRRLIRLRRQ